MSIFFEGFDGDTSGFDEGEQLLANISGLVGSNNDLIEFTRKLGMNAYVPVDFHAFNALAVGLCERLKFSPDVVHELWGCCFCRCSRCNEIKPTHTFYTAEETDSPVCHLFRESVLYTSAHCLLYIIDVDLIDHFEDVASLFKKRQLITHLQHLNLTFHWGIILQYEVNSSFFWACTASRATQQLSPNTNMTFCMALKWNKRDLFRICCKWSHTGIAKMAWIYLAAENSTFALDASFVLLSL